MHEPSDSVLLLAISRGDDAAARMLYARIGPRVAAYARALARDAARADDACQQAWLRALTRRPEELCGIRDAAAWLVRVVRSIILNSARTTARAAARERLRLAPQASHPAPLAGDHAALATAMDALDLPHREVVLLRHVAQLTFEQIAETLGEPRSTVASRHQAALERLRRALESPPARSSSPLPRTPEEAKHA